MLSLTACEPVGIGAAMVHSDWLALDSILVVPTPVSQPRFKLSTSQIQVRSIISEVLVRVNEQQGS
jgi:hypothetical protein